MSEYPFHPVRLIGVSPMDPQRERFGLVFEPTRGAGTVYMDERLRLDLSRDDARRLLEDLFSQIVSLKPSPAAPDVELPR